ncbi:Hypothetical predicted protein [Cloeon dipterum]|uniref:FAD synthase n=1 Tax=Cloeon dipterum TaxID=197152 RepID=A0A8S1DI69_9INSE|nr:Hypothetical predicted protein [Cloeon dipterum]
MESPAPTAAILVIGDEILKGHTRDTNSSFAAKIFYSLGIKVGRIIAISDNKEEIAEELRNLTSKNTFVVTSGGVGPTHDDITYEAVAAAFDLPLVFNTELAEIVESFYGVNDKNIEKNPAMKMAHIPQEHELFYSKKMKKSPEWATIFPMVKVRNVYVLPGLPKCFEACLHGLQHCFPSAIGSHFMDFLFLSVEESLIAHTLEDTIQKFKVVIGCYPILYNERYQTKLTVEAGTLANLRQALEHLEAALPANSLVELDPTSLALQKLQYLNSHDGAKTAFDVFKTCHAKYPEAEIVVSFNGGKDCTLLLHLYHLYLKSVGKAGAKVKALYIKNHETFSEVEEFVAKAVVHYNLELIEYHDHIKAGVEKLMSDHPNVGAILMGNRRTDPYSAKLDTFTMTDKGWPQVMRVFPILDWSYADVWQAIMLLGVDYCSLYDQGYSSLGDPHNTVPNPALSYQDESGNVKFRPAHSLLNGTEERAGRTN